MTKRSKKNTPAKLAIAPAKPAILNADEWSKERDRAEGAASARFVTSDLDNRERAFLSVCQQMYREDHGCDTPFQNFFHLLVLGIEHGRWPTPDDVRDGLIEFEENWQAMHLEARRFAERYARCYEETAEGRQIDTVRSAA
jgi:hypothetical protein